MMAYDGDLIMSFLLGVEKNRPIIFQDAWQKKNIIPHSGLMVIYHGTIH